MESTYFVKGEPSSFPFKELSFSAVRQYCTDRGQYFARYIQGKDFEPNAAMFCGAVAHKLIECYLIGIMPISKSIIDMVDCDIELSEEELEKVIKQANFAFNSILKVPVVEKVKSLNQEVLVEQKLQNELQVEVRGEKITIPIVAIADLIFDNKAYDWKIVTNLGKSEEPKPAYLFQAHFIFSASETPLKSVSFVEIKKTKNRDQSAPQFKAYTISHQDFLNHQNHFNKIIENMIKELLGEPLYLWKGEYIPNIFDLLNGQESFNQFISHNITKNGY